MPNDDDDIPADYKYVNWEHLERHVGRVILGTHVPLMTKKVAAYLRAQAQDLRHTAVRLDAAAAAIDPPPSGRGQ
jgi:hypothetical protein